MRANIVEAITGAVVLAVAGVFFYHAYSSSGTKVMDGYHLTASFDRIDGLVEGNDVKLSGVKVGDVSKISIDPKTYLAQVTISLEKNVQLPDDTSAQIVSESLMGGKYIALVPGGSDDLLKDGQHITHTQSSVNLEGLIGKYIFSGEDKK